VLLSFASAFAATFPAINDLNLLDVRVRLPEDIGGGRAVVMVSYSEAQHNDMQGWATRFLKEKLPFYEVPLMGEVGGMIEAALRVGMRAGREPDRREHVLPVFEEPPRWKAELGSDAEALDVLVVNGKGTISTRETGPWDEKKWTKIVGALR
jgi:hypothetical protein